MTDGQVVTNADSNLSVAGADAEAAASAVETAQETGGIETKLAASASEGLTEVDASVGMAEQQVSDGQSKIAAVGTEKQELQDPAAVTQAMAVSSDEPVLNASSANSEMAAAGTDKQNLMDPAVVKQATSVSATQQELKASTAKSSITAVGTDKEAAKDPASVKQATAVSAAQQELKASTAKSRVTSVGTDKPELKDPATVSQATSVSTDKQVLKASTAKSRVTAIGTGKQEAEDPASVKQATAVGTDEDVLKDSSAKAKAMAVVSGASKVSGSGSLAATVGQMGATVQTSTSAVQPAQVEFLDTEGRACLFKLNTSGALDYYVDGRHKASQIKQLEPVGNRVSFDGKRIMNNEAEATIREEDSDEVIAKLMDLANKAHDASAGDTNAIRCIVHVERAEGLRAADDCGTSDPYVVVTIPGKPKSSDQTTHKRRTLDPTWNEYVEVHGYEKGDELEFRVMDCDYLTTDDWLGTVTISEKDLADKKFKGTLALGDDNKHGADGNLVKGALVVQVWVATNGELAGELATELQEAMIGLSEREAANDLDNEDSFSRKDIIKGIISVLVGHRAAVTSTEVRTIAECYGFHGSDDEWACEFGELCSAQKWESCPDLEQFAGWLDDDTVFADVIVLGQVLDELKRRSENASKRPRYVANTWQTFDSTGDMISQKARESLLQEAFSALTGQAGVGGNMGPSRLGDYAWFCGFGGSEDEWQIEYDELSEKFELSEVGPDFEQFCKIVEGAGDASTWCSDKELRELIDMFRMPGGEGRVWQSTLRDQIWLLHPRTAVARAKLPREDLIKMQFDIYDVSGDGFLGPDELRQFANISGWRGDDDEWAVHYGEMVNDFNLNPRKGADLKQFEKIVDKKAGQSGIEAQDLVELIEDTAIAHSHMRAVPMSESQEFKGKNLLTKGSTKSRMTRSYSKHLSRAMSRKQTWAAVSKNYQILRSFGVFLRRKYVDTDHAFAAFSKKPFGRLTKADFLAALDRLRFDGQSESLFRLLSLGGLFIFKRHIKWAWNLLQAEGIVRARANSRATNRASRSKVLSSVQEDR